MGWRGAAIVRQRVKLRIHADDVAIGIRVTRVRRRRQAAAGVSP